jgi:hypothetical protein
LANEHKTTKAISPRSLHDFIALEGTTEWSVCAFLHIESNHGGIAIATNSNLVLEIRLLGSSCPDKTARQKVSRLRMCSSRGGKGVFIKT